MSQMLKCPNPSCPYVFDPSTLPPGVVLGCPRCAMQFTLAASQGSPGHGPAAGGLNSPASATEQRPAADDEFEQLGSEHEAERGHSVRFPSRGGNKSQVYILAGLAIVLMAGTSIALFFILRGRTSDSQQGGGVTRWTDFNVVMDIPPTAWVKDDDLNVKLGSPFLVTYKRESPEAYFAFGAWKPKEQDRAPRISELRRRSMGVFEPRKGLFDNRTLEEYSPTAASWMGITILPDHPYPNGIKFRIQSRDGVIWMGDALAVKHKGVAYHWMIWCVETQYESLKDEFAALRGRFRLIDEQVQWTEKVANVADFKGDKVPYTISDADPEPNQSWKELSPAQLEPFLEAEPDLDKRLRISRTPSDDRKALPETAELSVYIVDGTGDPTEAARTYAEQHETNRIKTLNPDFTPPTFKVLTAEDTPQGDPIHSTVYSETPVVRLISRVKESSNAANLIVVSGINVGNKIVIVHCRCVERERETFERKFIQIASSLR